MITFPNFVVGFLCYFFFSVTQAHSAENTVIWKNISQGLDFATTQHWTTKSVGAGSPRRGFDFVALRFHLGYYQVRLVDIAEFARTNRDRIARTQNVDRDIPALFELSLRTVAVVNPFDEPLIAVVPAGFPSSTRDPTNYGLLKIEGSIKSGLLERGPTAILCLNNAPRPEFQYQIPTFFRTNNLAQRKLVDRCRDEVQVGPRIIEDPKSVATGALGDVRIEKYLQKTSQGTNLIDVYLGVLETSAKAMPYLRAVFAVDDPGRFATQIQKETTRDIARNGYLIVTTTPATLWDLQDMLKSSEFYANPEYAPHWAVNLAGDNYAGLVLVDLSKTRQPTSSDAMIEIGGADQRQTSVLVVSRRK